jgi:hypothetical protein
MSNDFYERMGIEKEEFPVQIKSMNNSLRIDLWNVYYLFFCERLTNSDRYSGHLKQIHFRVWIHFLKREVDSYPEYNLKSYINIIKDFIKNEEWYIVYKLFEFTLSQIDDDDYQDLEIESFDTFINSKLKENNAGYTLIQNIFVPITNETEIQEVEKVFENSNLYMLNGLKSHLHSAISNLSNKEKPDYRNSIKESISMVEIVARIIEPKENTLGKALNKLSKNQHINSTFKSAVEKLYAYTNGKNGIRHAMMEDESINIEDARYFLIACSAFSNYLIEKAKKQSILN